MSEASKQSRVSVAEASVAAPRFVVLERQRLGAGSILLAIVIAACSMSAIHYGLSHGSIRHLQQEASRVMRGGPPVPETPDDDKDDPNQIDVIALGDAADAPVPARSFSHNGRVHPTIMVHLPRFGPEVGLIPNSAIGHLLYGWLAAFNQTNAEAMQAVLPSEVSGLSAEAQMELRQQTGGFGLLSAKEAAPGVLVFRMRDQTPDGIEVLGTLVMRPCSDPPQIQSFSLRSVPPEDAPNATR